MYSELNSTSDATKCKFAIVYVVDQTFTWVTGMPEPSHIAHVGRLPYISDNGATIAMGITTTSEGPHVYVVDIATAAAKKGLKVEAGSITALGKLSY